MKNVYIDSSESFWMKERFNKSLVTMDELLTDYEDLILENQDLKQELADLKQDLHDNYKPIPPEDQYE